jgi:spore photoproduct lyase
MNTLLNSSNLPVFNKIYIDKTALHSEVSQRIQKIYPAEVIEFIENESVNKIAMSNGPLTTEEFNQSKKTLLLTTYQGQFFKRCPGATQKKSLTCCNYFVLNLGSQCNMNCSYCYLQSYLNSKVTKIFVNIDDALNELKAIADEHPEQPFRVGTGEIIDSLSLDPITLYSRKLIAFFKNYPQWTLEFKTKSNTVDQFLDISGEKNIVVSWSINPPFIIDQEEHGTARFNERISAAKKCRDQGYRIAFHIDPMIFHQEWKENYSYLAEEIYKNFTAQDIQVISIGSLRFQPEQRHMMRERFGFSSLVNQAEMFPSEGNKLRYDANIRSEMFQFMYRKLKALNPEFNIFLCMETPETWIKSFEKIPMQMPELKNLFKPLPQVRD